ncbi:ABC transporter substrate-binding protein [Sulfurovum riftiae]|uniref:Peptide ABC transporter substrate-binding protein n=1 Tax=Sulfurovum riftiae TaxID=1630136 RepID=A0A151CH60_9BACT|nr:ABC transporter substrate-binding protein [Sulfurovum riftiae]KYJ86829.1 peptide ABC transporter substrate-binding protein [Sulfurovum riftiae]
MYRYFFSFLFLLSFSISLQSAVWNSPHEEKKVKSNTLFSAFSLPPKRLDPVISYNANEWAFIGQIYEPPLQYNYLKRPYELEPLTLVQMPIVRYLDANGTEVDENSGHVAYTEYTLRLREDIRYQNHPAFVKNETGELFYGHLDEKTLSAIDTLDDFEKMSTRRLKAEDYAYAIKRMAVRQNHSPILDAMMEYIVGLDTFSKKISRIAQEKKGKGERLDLRPYSIEGVRVVDERSLVIRIKGRYPQFLYWLSMNFFAPIPWEADLFYQQKGLVAKNITLNWFPVGTGPYYLAQNNPNRVMRLKANPNFHEEKYPSINDEEAKRAEITSDLREDAGKRLPFIEEIIYSLEKESIPLWNKFLQGYYDASGISSEAFDQAVQISSSGTMGLSETMRKKGIELKSSVQPSIFYMAFNMVDPIVGGYTESAKKLRQAISIAQNEEEYISIFMNERGIAAQGPIPPGIFGYEEGEAGTNKVVYDWKDGKRVRKPMEVAKKLLAEAGYPNGISAKTGKQLKLFYDSTATGPDDRALMDWRRKQFAKLGIQLVIRATDYNRFQDKVRKGKTQLFSWGWNADYPDPENFLFLLYGGNASVDTNGAGINSSNYKNPEFDRLFDEIKTMKNTPERKEKIEKMLQIAREDAPWVWGFHPKSLALSHAWFRNVLPNAMANNTLKYKKIDAALRVKRQQEWNQPVILPLVLLFVFVLLMGWLLYRAYNNRQKSVIIREEK